jgi:hypothetical protein
MSQIIIYAISIIVGLAVGLLVFIAVLKIFNKKNSKWGVNLKRVYCPVCDTKQPFIRFPDSFRQAMWGGTTCPKCHTHLDKWGQVIPEQQASK